MAQLWARRFPLRMALVELELPVFRIWDGRSCVWKAAGPLFSSSDPKSLSTQNGTSMATMDVVSLVTRLYAFLLQAAFYKFVLIWRLKTTILKSSNFSPAFGSEGSVLECLVHRLSSPFAISIDSIIFGIFSSPRTAWDLTMGLTGFACLALWRRRSPGGGV